MAAEGMIRHPKRNSRKIRRWGNRLKNPQKKQKIWK